MVELLAVIVIVGILATVGVIAVTNIISNSENKALVEEGLNLAAAGRYAYENNDSLAGSDKVCISLQTLNETGYYEKGKDEDYAGSVLITNNDGKITTTFWINKENSKYIEGASLTATEDNVVKETKLKYENKESLNNGSFCNFKTDSEKNGVNVGTKDNLDEYDGKTPISITVNNDSGININVQDINCTNENPDCPKKPDNKVTPTIDLKEENNYAVFYGDPEQTRYRIIGKEKVEYNQNNRKTGELYKLVQDSYATIKQVGLAGNKDPGDSSWRPTMGDNNDDYNDYTPFLDDAYSFFSPVIGCQETSKAECMKWDKSGLNKLILNGTQEELNKAGNQYKVSYYTYMQKKLGDEKLNKLIANVYWEQKNFNTDVTSSDETTVKQVLDSYNSVTKSTTPKKFGLLSLKNYLNAGWSSYNGTSSTVIKQNDQSVVMENVSFICFKDHYSYTKTNTLYKGLSEMFIDIVPSGIISTGIIDNYSECQQLLICTNYDNQNGNLWSSRNYSTDSHIRPALYLTPDATINQPGGSNFGSYDNPYVIT